MCFLIPHTHHKLTKLELSILVHRNTRLADLQSHNSKKDNPVSSIQWTRHRSIGCKALQSSKKTESSNFHTHTNWWMHYLCHCWMHTQKLFWQLSYTEMCYHKIRCKLHRAFCSTKSRTTNSYTLADLEPPTLLWSIFFKNI